jgi:hypothetical protein
MDRRSVPRSLVSDARQLTGELCLALADGQKLTAKGSLWDVSETGASFICDLTPELLDVTPGQAARLVVRYEEMTLQLETEVRHTRTVSRNTIVLGMRLCRTPASKHSLEQWPTLLWHLRTHGTLRNAS